MALVNRYESRLQLMNEQGNCTLVSRGKNMDTDRYNKKYQQLSMQSITPLKVYSYGVRFYYSTNDADDDLFDDHILVRPKYKSLKEELLMNEIIVMTAKQFNDQYRKAIAHYNSNYFKSEYRPYHGHHMTVNHILSMMIYCNFTQLQYSFSKTYRDNIHQHNNFWHLGLALKQCVHVFGKRISDGEIREFYHGIDQKMAFPSYINNVCIRCPLSTSTDFDVALGFATNIGMVIEFSGTNTKYISVGWLSDYPNEHECLFIQNDDNHPLSMNNITQTNIGMEYSLILDALRKLDKIIYSKEQRFKLLDRCSSDMNLLIAAIIEKQLTTHRQNSVFNNYAENIINKYFDNNDAIKKDYVQLLGLFYFHLKEDNLIVIKNGLTDFEWGLMMFVFIWEERFILYGVAMGNAHWRVEWRL